MVEDKSCSEIIGPWRFSKESIKKMIQITDNTKIIEHGGILCIRTEKTGEKRIDIISECKGTKCDLQVDPFNVVRSPPPLVPASRLANRFASLTDKRGAVDQQNLHQ